MFLLIRHGHTDFIGKKLVGRTPGIHLSSRGEREVSDLAQHLSALPVDGIFSSPLERTMETARVLASGSGLPVEVREDLNEIDYGEWTGRDIASLSENEHWVRYNRFRSTTRIPGGEWFVEVQARAVNVLEELRAAHPEGTLMVVSHGDVIKVAIAHYLGLHLDLITRLVIRTASVSGLSITDFAPEFLFMNSRGTPWL